MIVLAWILLLAASTSVDLVDEVYQIPASEWRYVELGLNQRPALVSAEYEVQGGSREVRLALMRRDDLDRLREGVPQSVIDLTSAAASGSLKPHVRGPGDFVVVVDNRGDAPAKVHLRVHLDFAVRRGSEVTQLSPRRQLAVVLISFAVFFGIVGWSARRLLRGIRR
ncbi:conserved hypothetical protein [Candidatus Sulfopaludibacter sp. SbA6]|nr:conserved hypothetical protein [Candidatus Sulfopaludibacter sp. SbA6]